VEEQARAGDKRKIASVDAEALPENHTHERMGTSLVVIACTYLDWRYAFPVGSTRPFREGEGDTLTRRCRRMRRALGLRQSRWSPHDQRLCSFLAFWATPTSDFTR
jgi:hypothetical protein